MGTNAAKARTAVYLADLIAQAGGRARFVSFQTRLAGEVQGRGAEKMRRGDHVMKYTLLTGFSYENMVKTSILRVEEVLNQPGFAMFLLDLLKEMLDEGVVNEQTGGAIGPQDLVDALVGTEKGRKGILTALRETEAGINVSTSAHVYEPLQVDGETVPGCKVYTTGPGESKTDPKAPVPGTIYLAGLVIASKVVEVSPNGNKIPSRRGAVARAKAFIEEKLDLPIRNYRTFRLFPGEAVSMKCGTAQFDV